MSEVAGAEAVSVIVPVYNGELYLREALESILTQELPLELIVVDDGSTDGTRGVLESFGSRIFCVHQKRQGTAAALNRGIRESRGDLLAFLDADDLWTAGKLSRQKQFLKEHPSVEAVFGKMTQFFSPDLSEDQRLHLQCPEAPLPAYCPGTLLIRREAFQKVGFFETQWRTGEFLDWFLKAREAGLVLKMLEEPLLKRRIHAANKGILEKEGNQDYLKILHRGLKRRKPDSGLKE